MKAVIFDYDGVLADSLNVHLEIYKIIADEMSLDINFEKVSGDFFEVNWRKTLDAVGIKNKEGIAQAEDIYKIKLKQLRKKINIFPQMKNLIPLLAKNHKLAIVSNSIEETIKSKLDDEGLSQYFDVVMGPFGEHIKPAPGQLVECLRRLDVKPDEALYVGDMDGDAVAAEAAGIKFIGVTWGYHSPAKLKADTIITSPKQLIEVL